MEPSQISWDLGTAYDLFISLAVLHKPGDFGVRGSWAAGVRARLPSDQRDMLEQGHSLIYIPFHWVHSLPQPKDGAAVLWALGQIPAAKRLPTLALCPSYPCSKVAEVLQEVATRGAWDEADREALRTSYGHEGKEKLPSAKKLAGILDWWSRPEEFGERYLEALRAYQEAFFAEEERRIRPALEAALARAQDLAGRLALPDLVEELSQGVRLGDLEETEKLVLAPSYWSTPLMFFGATSAGEKMLLFGARPPDASLVPGETVPDSLLRVLKALSDPTRLRIMHYLGREVLTAAELSRRLRLRVPTVTHHLKNLRLAGLVQLSLMEEKEMKQYAARPEAVAAACDSLKAFLLNGKAESTEIKGRE